MGPLRRDRDLDADPDPTGRLTARPTRESSRRLRMTDTAELARPSRITASEIAPRIVRYGELQPCKTAFIDAHTPGSNQKENFTIIGGGGQRKRRPARPHHDPARLQHRRGGTAAAGPQLACTPTARPRCSSSSPAAGGSSGAAGAMPARWCWRRATSSTSRPASSAASRISATDYGMIMAILGGDDAGGGVIWAPQVIEDAQGPRPDPGRDRQALRHQEGRAPARGRRSRCRC